ncbi:MAG: AAA family ATPase [Dehalococcoidia bacterium]
MADWELIGNARPLAALAAGVANGSPVHSYIFAGPERVGKGAAALLLAAALNCPNADPPCRACEVCRRIAEAKHADVQTVTVEVVTDDGPARKAISVEQMRDVEASVMLAPYEGRTRVVIIDPADQMSSGAQNAFLKTLEEPPPHVVFVLVTSDAERLLETVRSRCRRIEFGLVAAAEIEAGLLARDVDASKAAVLARLSAGKPGWALEAAASPALLERRGEALDAARALTSLSIADRMDLAEKLSDQFKRDRAPVDATLEQWLGWWRDVLLAASDAADSVANLDRREAIAEDARRYQRSEVVAFVEALRQTRQYLRENVQSRIALDALMLRVPGLTPVSAR